MAVSSKAKVGVGIGLFLFVGFWFINNFVYPFVADSPNFSDVERVFNRMQFPAEWAEIKSSENKGMFGRSCPIEPGSKCFHKGKRYKVPVNTSPDTIEAILKQAGCEQVSFDEQNPIGGNPYTNYECSVEGLLIDGSLDKGTNWETSFYVST